MTSTRANVRSPIALVSRCSCGSSDQVGEGVMVRFRDGVGGSLAGPNGRLAFLFGSSDIGAGGWRWTSHSPTGSGPEGSSPNELRFGSLVSLPPFTYGQDEQRRETRCCDRLRPGAGGRGALSRARPQIPAVELQ